MASFTLQSVANVFPVGTSVGAYLARYRRNGSSPTGSATATATVAADGTLTFPGVSDDTDYVAYASVSDVHRYINFQTTRPRYTGLEIVGPLTDGSAPVWSESDDALVAQPVAKTTEMTTRSLREWNIGVGDTLGKINDAIAASADEGFRLLGIPGSTVTVDEATGTKDFRGNAGAPSLNRAYAIEFPDGCDVDFAGMTFQGVEADDLVIACNQLTYNVASGTATADGSNTLTSVTGTGWAVGQYISDSLDAKIPFNTVITAVDGSTLTLSKNVTAGTGISVYGFSARDSCKIRNFTIDGGGTSGTRILPYLWLLGLAAGSEVDGITVRNGHYQSALAWSCEDTWFGRLAAHSFRGQGWVFGGNTGAQVRRCVIDDVRGWNLSDYGQPSQPGNSVCIGGVDVRVGAIYGRNCAGGHKILPNSDDIDILGAYFDGSAKVDETLNVNLDSANDNCGMKIQGGDTNSKLGRVSVGIVHSTNCYGMGLYLRWTDNIKIGSYTGYRNDTDGDGYDIDIAAIGDLKVGTMSSRYAGKFGMTIGSDMGRARFGALSIIDAGMVTTSGITFLTAASGEIRIADLEVMVVDSTATTPKAIFPSADIIFDVENYRSNIANCIDIRYGRVRLGNPILGNGTGALQGQVTLASSATTTDVANANIARANLGGGWIEPWVMVWPANAAARTLGTPYVTIPTTGTFRLTHSSAAGTEVYNWRIMEYGFRTNQLA